MREIKYTDPVSEPGSGTDEPPPIVKLEKPVAVPAGMPDRPHSTLELITEKTKLEKSDNLKKLSIQVRFEEKDKGGAAGIEEPPQSA